MKQLKSGDLAKQTGINVETLRYYEREGLLPKPERTESGYRQYSQMDVQKILFIKKAQELGFTLKEIKELLSLKISSGHSALEVKQLSLQKIQAIDAKITSLLAMEESLTCLVDACPGSEGDISECPILECLDSGHVVIERG